MPQNHRDPFDDYEDDDDAGYLTFDARDDDEGIRRGPIILVAILFLLAVFGAILWVYFVGGKSGSDEPPAISASTDSYKEAQLNDIGVPSNDIGNSVYGTSEGAEPPPLEVEAMNGAQTPLVPANAVAAPATTATPIAKETPPRPTTTAAPKAATPAPKATTLAPKAATTTPTPKAAAPAPAPSATIANAAPKAAPSTSPSAASSGSHAAQLGSFSTKAAADTALANYRATGLTGPVSIVAANLGAKGTWYRIRATGFENRAQVMEFCQKARSAGANCIPAN